MVGCSARYSIHMAVDVFIACIGITFFELKVLFNRHGSLMLDRHGPLVPLPSMCGMLLFYAKLAPL